MRPDSPPRTPPRPAYDALTSLYQRAIALVGLVALSPLLLALALAVKLTSPGPVLYTGARVGLRRRPFQIYKLRTMQVGAEQKIGKRLVRADEDHYTPIGRALRRYRLDELPQLLNVLRGEMALVGPRPMRPVFLDDLLAAVPRYGERFEVRPGITGLAQVHGGYYTSPRHKLRYDLLYIARRSLWLDLRLIALTFLRVMTRALSLGLALGWLLLAALALPEEALGALTVQLKHGTLNPLYLLLPALVALKVAVRGVERERLYALRTPLDPPLLALAGVAAAGVALSVHPAGALRGALWYLCNALLPFYLCVNAAEFRRDPARAGRWLALVGGGVSALALLGALSLGLAGGVWARVGGGLRDPLILSAGLVALAPLTLSAWRWARGGERRLLIACAAALSLALLGAGSRVALSALCLTGALWLTRRGLAALLAACALALALLAAAGDARLSPSSVWRDAGRVGAEVRRAVELVPPARWLVGAGARSGRDYLARAERQRPPAARPAPAPRLKSSATWLSLLLDFGLLGALLALATLWRVLRIILGEARARSARSDAGEAGAAPLRTLGAGLAAALLCGLACDLTASFPLTLLLSSLAGLGVGVALEGRRGPRRVYRIIHAHAPL